MKTPEEWGRFLWCGLAGQLHSYLAALLAERRNP